MTVPNLLTVKFLFFCCENYKIDLLERHRPLLLSLCVATKGQVAVAAEANVNSNSPWGGPLSMPTAEMEMGKWV